MWYVIYFFFFIYELCMRVSCIFVRGSRKWRRFYIYFFYLQIGISSRSYYLSGCQWFIYNLLNIWIKFWVFSREIVKSCCYFVDVDDSLHHFALKKKGDFVLRRDRTEWVSVRQISQAHLYSYAFDNTQPFTMNIFIRGYFEWNKTKILY